jgi:hypothetical protein
MLFVGDVTSFALHRSLCVRNVRRLSLHRAIRNVRNVSRCETPSCSLCEECQ